MTEPTQPDLPMPMPLPESHPLAQPAKGKPKRPKASSKPPLPLPELIGDLISEAVSRALGAGEPELDEQWIHDLVTAAFEVGRAKLAAQKRQEQKSVKW